MVAQQTGKGRPNALKHELVVELVEPSKAPAEVVYDLLADIRSHRVWAGEMQKSQSFRLLSVEAPEGPAKVGTEFRTTGADPSGRFTDSSVVTEATRPGVFEFVTEAHLETKKGKGADWTNVHRYALTPEGPGCRVGYTVRILRISDLPGAMALFKVPGLRSIGLKVSATLLRRGLRNLARLAESRAGV